MAANIDLKNIKLNINFRTPPKWVKTLVMVLPIIITVPLVLFLVYLPNQKIIDQLKGEIETQEKEIAKSQSMAAKLEDLVAENAKLKKKLTELKSQLPAEKEISSLLDQVSNLALQSNMTINSWRPGVKRTHASTPPNLVYEVPVNISMTGTYHNIGKFFASLTSLDRIVTVSGITYGGSTPKGEVVVLSTSFTAITYTLISEEVLTK